MKLNDYGIVGYCKHCGKPIFSPRSWVGINKDMTYDLKPEVPTCLCAIKRKETL